MTPEEFAFSVRDKCMELLTDQRRTHREVAELLYDHVTELLYDHVGLCHSSSR